MSVARVKKENNVMKNHAKLSAEPRAKLKSRYARALDIEDILSDPGKVTGKRMRSRWKMMKLGLPSVILQRMRFGKSTPL